MRVFEGGEGWTSGGKSERSSESGDFDREDARDRCGDGIWVAILFVGTHKTVPGGSSIGEVLVSWGICSGKRSLLVLCTQVAAAPAACVLERRSKPPSQVQSDVPRRLLFLFHYILDRLHCPKSEDAPTDAVAANASPARASRLSKLVLSTSRVRCGRAQSLADASSNRACFTKVGLNLIVFASRLLCIFAHTIWFVVQNELMSTIFANRNWNTMQSYARANSPHAPLQSHHHPPVVQSDVLRR